MTALKRRHGGAIRLGRHSIRYVYDPRVTKLLVVAHDAFEAMGLDTLDPCRDCHRVCPDEVYYAPVFRHDYVMLSIDGLLRFMAIKAPDRMEEVANIVGRIALYGSRKIVAEVA